MRPPAAALLLFAPLLISPKSDSISGSFPGVSCEMAFPSPVSACGWALPAPLALRLCPLFELEYPLGNDDDVSGRGNGDGSSSTESEFGFGTGTTVAGSWWCWNCEDWPPPWTAPKRDAGGGGELILFRSFRVM